MADFTNKVQVVFKGGGRTSQAGRQASTVNMEYEKFKQYNFGKMAKKRFTTWKCNASITLRFPMAVLSPAVGGVPDAFLVTDIKLESQTPQANLYFQYYENWTGMYTTKAMLIYKMYQKYNYKLLEKKLVHCQHQVSRRDLQRELS